jgi:hypothetical protein
MNARRSLGLLLAATAVALAGALLAGLLLLGRSPAALARALGERTPRELVRYAARRLVGHDRLEALAAPVLNAIRQREERPIPDAPLPSLGKGQQDHALGRVHYDAGGRPLPLMGSSGPARALAADVLVRSVAELEQATRLALPGQVIEIVPGHYRLDRSLALAQGGRAGQPITLRAARPGTVILEVAALQGMRVGAPYWVLENLDWRGQCGTEDHRYCEHAIHVVGAARGTVVLNNRMVDFNAHLKVNGENGSWPDDGLVQFTTLENSGPRHTDNPVTPFDLVGANGWQVADNLIANFIRTGRDGVSYGAFMKGGGSDGTFERNLVICTRQDISRFGLRVGLSFGGGGTAATYCRDGRCDAEFRRGRMLNNVVAHCNDFGIDVMRSSGVQVLNNTLVNTAGIDVRSPLSSASVLGNVTEGRIRARDQALLLADHNIELATLAQLFQDPDRLVLLWQELPPAAATGVSDDFCGQPRRPPTRPGATVAASCATTAEAAGHPR